MTREKQKCVSLPDAQKQILLQNVVLLTVCHGNFIIYICIFIWKQLIVCDKNQQLHGTRYKANIHQSMVFVAERTIPHAGCSLFLRPLKRTSKLVKSRLEIFPINITYYM